MSVSVCVFSGCDGKTESGITPLNYVIYSKEGSMYYDSMNGSEPIELTDYYLDRYDFRSHYAAFTTLSKNQNRIFYFSELYRDTNRGTLVYRDVIENGNLSDEYEVDTDVHLYKISDDGDTVLYTKGENRELLLMIWRMRIHT